MVAEGEKKPRDSWPHVRLKRGLRGDFAFIQEGVER